MNIFSKKDVSIEDIHFLINKYNLNNYGTFSQSELHNVPIQGWKLHVACDSLNDYYKCLKTMLPELIKNNITFKIVNPEYYQENPGRNMFRKEITIYPNENFKLNSFSKKVINLLNESISQHSLDEAFLGGRVTGRYGSYRHFDIIAPNGSIFTDEKNGNLGLNFMGTPDINKILSFYQRIESEFQYSSDFNRYLNQYAMGVAFDDYLKMPEYPFKAIISTNKTELNNLATRHSGHDNIMTSYLDLQEHPLFSESYGHESVLIYDKNYEQQIKQELADKNVLYSDVQVNEMPMYKVSETGRDPNLQLYSHRKPLELAKIALQKENPQREYFVASKDIGIGFYINDLSDISAAFIYFDRNNPSKISQISLLDKNTNEWVNENIENITLKNPTLANDISKMAHVGSNYIVGQHMQNSFQQRTPIAVGER